VSAMGEVPDPARDVESARYRVYRIEGGKVSESDGASGEARVC